MPQGPGFERWQRFMDIFAREASWLAREMVSYVKRSVALPLEHLRDVRLRSRRGRIVQEIGEGIRKRPDLPDSLAALAKACDEAEAQTHIYRQASGTATGTGKWLDQIRRHGRLILANAAYRRSLVKLGAAGTSEGPKEIQERLQNVERALSVDGPARRQRLLEPWKVLSARRRVAVRAGVVLVVGATVFLMLRSVQPAPFIAIDADTSPDATGTTSPPAVDLTAQVEAFEQQGKQATIGQWVFFPGNPVVSRGDLTSWDDFKVTSPVVIRETGLFTNRFRMWYRGCHFIGGEYSCGLGSATSKDGVVWEKSPKPLLMLEGAIDRERFGTITIAHVRDRYYLFYSVSTDVHTERSAFIGLATSADGSSWTTKGPVLNAESAATASLEPSALHDGQNFHLWYIDRATPSGEPALLHWMSIDGEHWQMTGSTRVTELGTKPGRVCVIQDGRGGYLGYFANARNDQQSRGLFGIMASDNGSAWHILAPGPKDTLDDVTHGGWAASPAVLTDRNRLWMWFVQQPMDGADAIGVAFSQEQMP